jgi:hypothetical protein
VNALPVGDWLYRLVDGVLAETGNWKVHRFGCAHRVEILAKKYDFAAGGT